MAQHYVPHAGYYALCGEHMLGRRNSRLDEDPEATTCKGCQQVLEEQREADAPDPMTTEEANEARGFADDGDIDGWLMDAYDSVFDDCEGWN